MTIIDTTCAGCGKELSLELEGESRWLRAMAARVRCDECAAKQEAFEIEREQREVREARRARCGLPNRLRGETLDRFPAKPGQRAAVAAVGEWARERSPGGLMLVGETGVGKTRIAAAACWTRLENWPCVYASVARAMAKLGASFTDQGRAEAVRVFSGNGAVILDDLDKTRPSDYGCEQLFSAVDAREQAGAPMLITTNLTPSEIGERYGEPLMSRLSGYCRTIRVDGQDWRVAT